MSDRWPEAVNPNLICDINSDEDKSERGRGIIDILIEEDLKDLKFLDFGCGEGHCPAIATEYAREVQRLIDTGDWSEAPAFEDQLPLEWMPEAFFAYWTRDATP